MSTILAVKTRSAEEVIGTIIDDEPDFYILSKPRVLVMQQAADGSVSLGMLPFMASANNPAATTESDVKLLKSEIIAEVLDVPKPLEDAYLQQVSDIVLPK